MSIQNRNVLLFTRSMELGGTENVVLQLCEILKPHVNKVIVCSCGGVNEEKIKKIGIKHYLIPDIENKNPITIINVCYQLKRIITDEKINIIHTHHRMAAFYISLLRLHKNRIFFNTNHNTFQNRKVLTRYAFKNAELIACGEKVKENLTEFFDISDTQVTVIHNAVKPFLEKINIDKEIEKLHEDGCFVIGNIGRLAEQKGMEYYIKSIPLLIKKHKKMRFLLIGSGNDEQKLKRLVHELDVAKYVMFLGYREDIQNIMSQLDLVVLSSLWEGLPLTPIEAFSVGKTIIATAVDGTVEIVKDNENGLLVNPKDYKQLAEMIEYIYLNHDKRQELEQNAKLTYEKSFSYKQLEKNYLEYYKKNTKSV